jgi:hypothetical protein
VPSTIATKPVTVVSAGSAVVRLVVISSVPTEVSAAGGAAERSMAATVSEPVTLVHPAKALHCSTVLMVTSP